MNRDELAARLHAIFLSELEEQLQSLNEDLLALEAQPEDAKRLASLFRVVHTLKGAAHAAHVPQVEEVCHALEALLARARDGQLVLGPGEFSLLFGAADALADGEERLRAGRDLADSRLAELARSLAGAPAASPRLPTTSSALPVASLPAPAPPEALPSIPAPLPVEAPIPAAEPAREHVRVEAEKLDMLLASSAQLIMLAGRFSAKPAQLEELQEHVTRWRSSWERTARRLRQLTADGRLPAPLQSEIQEVGENVRRVLQDTGRLAAAAREDARALSHLANEVGDRLHRLRLRPFSDACVALPRLIRDLAASSGKEVRLQLEGGEVKADRAVLDVLQEVLLQLVRNAVDHGIEPPEGRERVGKPRVGTVTISAAHLGRRLLVTVADDGRGVDLDAVRAQLTRSGRPLPESREELARALFHPGFSTRASATAISGRGVGLDVVRTTVERIRGSVQVSWVEGEGTTFSLECPPSLATIRALLVVAGSQRFAFPTVHVERLVRIRPDEIRSAEGREVILTDDSPVPLVSLARLLGPPLPAQLVTGPFPVVRLRIGERRLAVAVDELVAEEEIVVRPLDRVRGPSLLLSGASLLGSGRIALVLNTSAVLDQGLERTVGVPLARFDASTTQRKRILVVDDSITTRTLEESILQAAGYEVHTAVDGSQAWQLLQETPFDLVVSDIEMPRMDGFELCAAIRASKRLSATPVVLVTGLEAPEHRARGLEAGANAYLPKSSFDQQDLLDTLRQLLG